MSTLKQIDTGELMTKYCKNCGAENKDTATFCSKCGSRIHGVTKDTNQSDKEKKIIIALIAIAAILAIGIGVYASGILNGEVPLETHNFGTFEMLVPEGSDFAKVSSMPAMSSDSYTFYQNQGEYSKEAYSVGIAPKDDASQPSGVTLERKEGGVTVYKDNSGNDAYYLVKDVDNYNIVLMGSDDKTLMKMINSVNIKDKTTTASPSAPASPTTQSMTIQGGSFSTGSSLSDKTYAKIYVGPGHSGEQVTVQIWYSRDGSTLNHGNMVPVHVDSSGYLSISSADAYSKYPDHATINLYDSSGSKLLDTVSVNLSPTSGTQSF